MINSLEIKNFQSHKNTKIDFCPGLNVIAGASDSGKSSILRAIGWLIKNRPSGDAIRNWDCKKNDPVTVTISLEDNNKEETITKERIGSTSKYVSSKFGALDVIGRDVPEEVTRLLNLSEPSFQTQHDAYFLLNDSPGSIAKTLNDLVGLSIIDTIFKNINSQALASKRRVEESQNSVKSLQIEIDKLQYLDSLDKELTEAGQLLETLNTKKVRLDGLSYILQGIDNTEGGLAQIKKILPAEKEVVVIKNKQQRLSILQTKHSQITNLIKSIEESITRLDEEKEWLTIEKPFLAVKKKVTQLEELKSRENILKRLVERCVSTKELIEGTVEKISKAKIEFKDTLKRNKVCPVCFRPFDKKTIEGMVE
uniref:Putative ATPase domain containing protein n=1 Tax=viral metagenome TaxID=1070528 RepID=A0A6M3M0C8_9ZZZZ